MKNVSDYMAVVIEDNGSVNYLGRNFSFPFHDACLIDYAKRKYPTADVFNKIDYMEYGNLPIYYLNKLSNIVFTNISVDDEKRGMLYVPDYLTDVQVESLNKLMEMVVDFNIYVEYNLKFDEFVLGSEFILSDLNELNNFCMKRIIETGEVHDRRIR